MTAGPRTRHQVEAPAPPGRTPLRSLVVPLDLSAVSDRVVRRAALLPLAAKARLTLLHVVPDSLRARARQRAVRDAKRALADERAHLAEMVPRGVTVRQVVGVGAPAAEIAACARDVEAELVVMGRGGGRGLRDAFLGSTAERVIRRGQLPVLAVRLAARAPYRRPALALSLEQTPDDALRMLLRLAGQPRAPVTIIHAFDIPYHGLIYPSVSEDDAEEYLDHYRRTALGELTHRLAAALARERIRGDEAPPWRLHLRYGDARSVIRKIVRKEHTDLLALATRGYRGVAHAFLGTVAGDVLRGVPCDVLVVPRRRRATRTE